MKKVLTHLYCWVSVRKHLKFEYQYITLNVYWVKTNQRSTVSLLKWAPTWYLFQRLGCFSKTIATSPEYRLLIKTLYFQNYFLNEEKCMYRVLWREPNIQSFSLIFFFFQNQYYRHIESKPLKTYCKIWRQWKHSLKIFESFIIVYWKQLAIKEILRSFKCNF